MSDNQKGKSKAKIILPIILVAILTGSYLYWKQANRFETTDNAQIETYSAPVLSRVSGYVDSLGIEDYKEVKAGQPLLRLDDREFKLSIEQCEADLASSKADLQSAKANLHQLEASLQVAISNEKVQRSRVSKAKLDEARDAQLSKDEAISKKQSEDSRSNRETAERQLDVNANQVTLAQVQCEAARAAIEKAKASIATRMAALEQAKLRLSYTQIMAPMSGRLGKINLAKGQYVNQGQNLFTIINDSEFWIVANFKETQIARIKPDQKVEVKLDGFPDDPIEGRVAVFSEATGAKFSLLPPDNATGNFIKVAQRVPIKIRLMVNDAWKSKLKAGLSAEVRVNVE
jgi:membrane fusion protein (multidrug efflux system)